MIKFKTFILASLSIIVLSAFNWAIELETQSILDGKVEIKLPNDFGEMSEEIAKFKYPQNNRPTLIYTDEAAAVNVAFNLKQNVPTTQAGIKFLHNSFVQSMESSYPSAEWKGKGIKTINGKKVGYIELITPAMDTKVYNLVFFTDLDGKLLLCTFNCTMELMNEWKSSAKEIMNSLKIK